MKVAMPFARPLVELVFDLLNLGIGEGAQIAALGEVLAQQTVRIFVTAALPSGIRLGEVARRIERDVDQGVFGELAGVVLGERVHTGADRIQGMQDRSHRGVGFTVGDTPQTRQAGLAFDQGHDADRPLADDGVAFPVADTLAAVDDRRALRDAAPSEALTLPWRAAAVSSPSLAASKMLPQGATAIAQQHLRSLLGYCNSPQMNSPEAYIQFKPDMITADGDVTIKDTEDFLRTYMQELHAFIVRVMTVHPREQ